MYLSGNTMSPCPTDGQYTAWPNQHGGHAVHLDVTRRVNRQFQWDLLTNRINAGGLRVSAALQRRKRTRAVWPVPKLETSVPRVPGKRHRMSTTEAFRSTACLPYVPLHSLTRRGPAARQPGPVPAWGGTSARIVSAMMLPDLVTTITGSHKQRVVADGFQGLRRGLSLVYNRLVAPAPRCRYGL